MTVARRDVQQYLQDFNKLLPQVSREVKERSIHRYFRKRRLVQLCPMTCCGWWPWPTLPACQGFALVVAGPCPGQHKLALGTCVCPEADAYETRAAHTNPSLLGDSQNAKVTFCSGAHYPGTEAWEKCGKPTPNVSRCCWATDTGHLSSLTFPCYPLQLQMFQREWLCCLDVTLHVSATL